MTSTPLERLCSHRGIEVPAPDKLLDLVPTLALRPADVLAIAGGEVPSEYLPVATDGGKQTERACRTASAGGSDAMRHYAQSLPKTRRTTGMADLPALPTVTFGAIFGRLMLVRNLTRRAMAIATMSAQSTVNIVVTDHRVPSPQRMVVMAAMLCLRVDDVEAMAARPIDQSPADPWAMECALAEVPRLWSLGELLWALTPLLAEQIDAVTAFGSQHHEAALTVGTAARVA